MNLKNFQRAGVISEKIKEYERIIEVLTKPIIDEPSNSNFGKEMGLLIEFFSGMRNISNKSEKERLAHDCLNFLLDTVRNKRDELEREFESL